MKKILYILSLSLLFICCEKEEQTKPDPLIGELEFLVGKWEWKYSIQKKTNINSGISTITYKPADSFPVKYYLQFESEGYLMNFNQDSIFSINPIYKVDTRKEYCFSENNLKFYFDLSYEAVSDGHSKSLCSNDTMFQTYNSYLPHQEWNESNQYEYYYTDVYKKIE